MEEKFDFFTHSVPKGQGMLCVLGQEGDTKITWSKKNKDEVANAKRTFNNFVNKKKFAAFSVSKLGRKSKKITKFDPNIQKIIFIPPMAGGSSDSNVGTIEQPMTWHTDQPVQAERPIAIDEKAEIKAFTLLKKKVGEEKFIKFAAAGYIETKGKYGVYKIKNTGAVELKRFDKIGEKKRPLIYDLCISTESKQLPRGDNLLALFILIKEDEDKFIQTANFRFVRTDDEFNERRG